MVQIPIRPQDAMSTAPTLTPSSIPDPDPDPDVSLTLHPTSNPGLILKVQPPTAAPHLTRTPCDIVLAIDVSASMSAAAPVPGGASEPNYGFSVLDLTKHAALTILETLGEGDRLGIVTFTDKVRVLRELEVVDEGNKVKCREAILGMQPLSATNLWGAIVKGLELFEGPPTGRNPALLVLTDGMPNHQCPPQGYVSKLLQRESIPAAIHTFGFGKSLRSGLLKSIADVGGGNYAYIPDSSMLGTVFIHAVANLQSTYANTATLHLRYPRELALDTSAPMGLVAAGVRTADVEESGRVMREVLIHLGAPQYGQSRDVFIRAGAQVSVPVEATLQYSRMTAAEYSVSGTPASPLSPEEEAYHISRAQVCAAIGSLYRLSHGEHVLHPSHTHLAPLLSSLSSTLPASSFPSGPQNASLLAELDISSDGQIPLAASPEFLHDWGAHYLLGLKSAHEKQACNSFKDPGPLMYGLNSPLFVECRDRLDEAFDGIEPPMGSLRTEYTGVRDMSVYRSSAAPCFAGETVVRVGGGSVMMMKELRKGMLVETPVGGRRVVSVLKTPVEGQVICRVGDVLVTPWHPVSSDGENWVFPAETTSQDPVLYTGAVYSALLEASPDPAAHAISVGNGLWGVTLGHGVVAGDDVRAHAFLGDNCAVGRELEVLGESGDGVVVGGGVKRGSLGVVCGFLPFVPQERDGIKGGVRSEGAMCVAV